MFSLISYGPALTERTKFTSCAPVSEVVGGKRKYVNMCLTSPAAMLSMSPALLSLFSNRPMPAAPIVPTVVAENDSVSEVIFVPEVVPTLKYS